MLKKIRKNKLLKITSFNTLSVLIKLITGILISKIFALFLGPKGFALIGNLRNFMGFFLNIGTLSIEKGIVREASRNKENKEILSQILRTILVSSLILSILLSVIIIVFFDKLTQIILINQNLRFIIITVAITLPFFVLHTVIQSIINGIGSYKKVILINILISISNPIIIYILTLQFNIKGTLFAIAIMPILFFFITLKTGYKKLKEYLIVSEKVSSSVLKKLGSYAIMYIPSAVMFPLLYIFIRNYITNNLGFEDAGFYEAMQRVSLNYMLFANSLLPLYLLPEIAPLSKKKEIFDKIVSFSKTFLPLFIIGLLLIFAFKNIVINILYTKEFNPISSLFKWQLLGDFFRFISLILVIVFHANKMVLTYVLTDTILVIFLGGFSIYFIDRFGVEGSVIAHFVSYVSYFIIIILIFSFRVKSNFVNQHSKIDRPNENFLKGEKLNK